MSKYTQPDKSTTSSSSVLKETAGSPWMPTDENPFPSFPESPPPLWHMSVPDPPNDSTGNASRQLPSLVGVRGAPLPLITNEEMEKLSVMSNEEFSAMHEDLASVTTTTSGAISDTSDSPSYSAIDEDTLPIIPDEIEEEFFGVHRDSTSFINQSSNLATVASMALSDARSTPSPTRLMPMQEDHWYNSMGLPIADGMLAPSLRIGTPFTQSSQRSTSVLEMENGTIESVDSWGEAAEDDLVKNIGSRERTRQEVLWEIVASEQRWVFTQISDF